MLLEAANLMVFDPETSALQSNEQYTAQVYRPTPEFVSALADAIGADHGQ